MSYRRAVVLVGLLAAVTGCRVSAMLGEEVDQKIDFLQSVKIAVTRDVAHVYRVYAMPTNHEEDAEEIFRTNVRDGVAMDWEDKETLKLTIACEKVITFKNVYDIHDEQGLWQRMKVRLEAEGSVNCPPAEVG